MDDSDLSDEDEDDTEASEDGKQESKPSNSKSLQKSLLINFLKLEDMGKNAYTNNAMEPARWPVEFVVRKKVSPVYPKNMLNEKIKHINYIPPRPERYYLSNGREDRPQPVGDKMGTVVYQYRLKSSTNNRFTSASSYCSRIPPHTCPAHLTDSLKFESRFESGNLAKVVRVNNTDYQLYIRNDLYTDKWMEWFYFRVTNMHDNVLYRFSIVNMTKDQSLYNEGMKPLLYSVKDSRSQIGWKRCGENIVYYPNRNLRSYEQMTYTLSFNLQFPHAGDTVYLAYSYPYTYSDLQQYLSKISRNSMKARYTNISTLCKTLAGNNVYCLTVGTSTPPGQKVKKRAIIVTARVHPGEAPSSWMMKGLIDFLTSDTELAKKLRQKFIFKLVPMLNPDGVIVGNSRVSLSGSDLNREYRTAVSKMHPPVWHTKLMIQSIREEYDVAMYIDLHAHSIKHNIFLYGCESKSQVFPSMLGKNAGDKFSFDSCEFSIKSCYEGTGRIFMWRMGISNSYTLEASFGGSLLRRRLRTLFTSQDYEQMGHSMGQTLADFYYEDRKLAHQTLFYCCVNVLRQCNEKSSDFCDDASIKEVEKELREDSEKSSEICDDTSTEEVETDKSIEEVEIKLAQPKSFLIALCTSLAIFIVLIYNMFGLLT